MTRIRELRLVMNCKVVHRSIVAPKKNDIAIIILY
jgi:hypothetical protein